MAIDLQSILEGAAKFRASDIHMMEGWPPYLRVDGLLGPVQAPPFDKAVLEGYLGQMLAPELNEKFRANGGVDFAYCPASTAGAPTAARPTRYRVNAYHERGHLKIVMRVISSTVPSLEELELPEVLKRLATLTFGMVLVTGATGSGKSTTLAAMIKFSNSLLNRCIITIEDPIEYFHENQKSIVTQREVGADVPDFNTGLVQALRQDPDVILIGEMRDAETMRVSIKASETGHLVFSTLHTTNAVQTIERIIATFAEEERQLIREQLATNLKGALSQRLVRRAGGKGRAAAMEIMVVNTTIEKLIFENRIRDIPGVIAGREEGMMTFDQSLSDLVRAKVVEQPEAEAHCNDVFALRRFVKGIKSTGESGGIIMGFG